MKTNLKFSEFPHTKYKFSDNLLNDLLKLCENPLPKFSYVTLDHLPGIYSYVRTKRYIDIFDSFFLPIKGLNYIPTAKIPPFVRITEGAKYNGKIFDLKYFYEFTSCHTMDFNMEIHSKIANHDESFRFKKAKEDCQKYQIGKEIEQDFLDAQIRKYRFESVISMYLATGTPDLREFKFPAKGTRAEKTKASMEYHTEDCILVGYNWQKQRQSHVESWYSRGHFWLAPVGPNREFRELRWRNGCEKTARKENTEE